MEGKRKITVGIDLGTTYSAIAYYDAAVQETCVLKNSSGSDYTPSVVCIENGNVYIGEEAKQMQENGNKNAAAFYKSMMGDKTYVMSLDGKDYTPMELSGMFLREFVREISEANNVLIQDAVISVPAYFNEAQRNATVEAGKMANLVVHEIINEPTAALIAYGLNGSGSKNALIYDLGGGTFDVTIAHIEGNSIDVLTTAGNHQLGGKVWDLAIFKRVARLFMADTGMNIDSDISAKTELIVECEKAKKSLSTRNSVEVRVAYGGSVSRYTVTREEFESDTASFLLETQMLIDQCFSELTKTLGKNFGWQQIDEVVLVGGSTRMPQVKSMIVREYGKEPYTKKINVDTIVAVGAAMQASLATTGELTLKVASNSGSGLSYLTVKRNDISDVTAHSLGMLAHPKADDKSFINSIIIPKSSPVGKDFTKEYDFSGNVLEVYVLQGEEQSPYACTPLYKYSITGIPQTDKKQKIAVSFRYNNNGLVEVSAKVSATGAMLTVQREELGSDIENIIAMLSQQQQKPMETQILMLSDTSGSMSSDIAKVREALCEFVRQINNSAISISLVSFADSCLTICGFISNTAKLTSLIEGLTVGSVGYGTSATPISEYSKSFKSNDTNRIMIVLTDGQWGNQTSEIAAANKAKADGVTIYAIGFGSADNSFLKQIASDGCAKKVNISELVQMYSTIASTIATEASSGFTRLS